PAKPEAEHGASGPGWETARARGSTPGRRARGAPPVQGRLAPDPRVRSRGGERECASTPHTRAAGSTPTAQPRGRRAGRDLRRATGRGRPSYRDRSPISSVLGELLQEHA